MVQVKYKVMFEHIRDTPQMHPWHFFSVHGLNVSNACWT